MGRSRSCGLERVSKEAVEVAGGSCEVVMGSAVMVAKTSSLGVNDPAVEGDWKKEGEGVVAV